MSKERLEEIVDGLLNNRLELTSFVSESLEQAERVEKLEYEKAYLERLCKVMQKKINEQEQQNKRYRDVIKSMTSEIKYALYSNKPKDVKEHYLKNAERYGVEALEESE